MKNEWSKKKLSTLCSFFTDGNWIESKDQDKSGIRLIQTGNVGLGVFRDKDNTAKFVNEKTFNKLRCTEIFPGDVLVSRLPDPVGRACVVPDIGGRMITAVDCSILRFKKTEILPEFFNYYSQSNKYLASVKNKTTGTTRERISRKNLGEVEVPITSLESQKRIVTKISAIFADAEKAKENAKKNLQNAQLLFESYLQKIFNNPEEDWEQKTLKEISLVFGRGRSKHRPRNDKGLYGGKYPFIQTGDIRNSRQFITKYTQTYNEKGLSQSKLWPKGTICITIAANIAETGILDFDACFPDSVIGLIVNPKLASPQFIEFALKFDKGKLRAKSKGSAQNNLNLAKFEHEYFPIPPLNKQVQIVDKLTAVYSTSQKLMEVYMGKLAHFENLKNSVLNKAFNGEL